MHLAGPHRRAADTPRPVVGGRVRRARDRGSVTIELVVVFPIVLLLIFAGLQTGIYYYGRSIVLAGAQEGVRVGRVLPVDPVAGAAAAQAYLEQVGAGTLINPDVDLSSDAETVTVTVTAQVRDLLGGLLTLTATQTASGPVERVSR